MKATIQLTYLWSYDSQHFCPKAKFHEFISKGRQCDAKVPNKNPKFLKSPAKLPKPALIPDKVPVWILTPFLWEQLTIRVNFLVHFARKIMSIRFCIMNVRTECCIVPKVHFVLEGLRPLSSPGRCQESGKNERRSSF